MAKKKSVELIKENIKFELDKNLYEVIRFYPDKMTLDVMVYEQNGVKIGVQNIVFAHIPKKIKKIIKPN